MTTLYTVAVGRMFPKSVLIVGQIVDRFFATSGEEGALVLDQAFASTYECDDAGRAKALVVSLREREGRIKLKARS